jgi:hypothetical protein
MFTHRAFPTAFAALAAAVLCVPLALGLTAGRAHAQAGPAPAGHTAARTLVAAPASTATDDSTGGTDSTDPWG